MKMSLLDFLLPLFKSLDTYNYLLKSHQRRVAVIAYSIGKQMRLTDAQLCDLVIAALVHDIGALTIEDQDMLLEVDVSDPKPHCQMGYEMLRASDLLQRVAQIVKHHHIFYYELNTYNEEIPIESHIIHVADRIEVYIDKSEMIQLQISEIKDEIMDRKGDLFHPEVCGIFERLSRSSSFWKSINTMSLEHLIGLMNNVPEVEVTPDTLGGLSLVLSRMVDFRCKYTSAHSLTVGNLAQYIGELLEKEEDFNVKLLIAGLLHDVGKVSVNPSIITKQDSLEKEEYETIQLIPVYNENILQDLRVSPWFDSVVDWISKQQNKTETSISDYDKVGVSIIELSHIITALLEKRPYRGAYDIDSAFKILREELHHRVEEELLDFVQEHQTGILQIIQMYEKEGTEFFQNIPRDFEYY